MNATLKVQAHHLERDAYLYIRQSSMRQVHRKRGEHQASVRPSWSCIRLGWRDDRVIVIDTDQGESGASTAWREGFRHLVTDVAWARRNRDGPGGIPPRPKQRRLASPP